MARKPYDKYYTPEWCYQILPIDWSQFDTALEPAAGDFRLVKYLRSRGLGTEWCEITQGRDFFTVSKWWLGDIDIIVTNPPFSSAKEFIVRALEIAPTVVMLLRLDLLGSLDRFPLWNQHPYTSLYALSKRPSFTLDGKTDASNYGWFVWDSTGKIPKENKPLHPDFSVLIEINA